MTGTSKKYLYTTNDYDNFEFRSPVNPWQVQPEYRADFDKVKTMDVVLSAGQIIYIPAYWWCSMQFMEDATTLCCFKYCTYMNAVSIVDKLCLWLLQKQNACNARSPERAPTHSRLTSRPRACKSTPLTKHLLLKPQAMWTTNGWLHPLAPS